MIIFKKINDLQRFLAKQRKKNLTTGFVPTMGALHKGHNSLIEKALADCNIIICSIFVNPAQFNNPDDFKKYPNTIEYDIYSLEKSGTHILFYPAVHEMYPDAESHKHYNLGYLENILEGKYRPGHFQGVCRIVDKLLNIIKPDKIYFGQKDYQQCMVVKKMMLDKGFKSEMIIGDTVREENGLAMSSRNLRLSPAALKQAATLYNSLKFVKTNIGHQPLHSIIHKAEEMLLNSGFEKTDYITVCNAATLLPASRNTLPEKLIALAAAYIEGVRLIDNLLLTETK